jgi:hypothetical protein
MPNWCENYLDVSGPRADVVRFMEENKPLPTDKDNENEALSFNRSVPLPESEKENWYDWRINNWGTKWEPDSSNVVGADGSSVDDVLQSDAEQATLYYSLMTAWAPPVEWLSKTAALYPTLTFTMKWVESGMCFAGQMTLENGAVTVHEEYDNADDEGYKAMYCEVFGEDAYEEMYPKEDADSEESPEASTEAEPQTDK